MYPLSQTIPSGSPLPLSTGTRHRGGRIPPQRLSSTVKHARVDGILTTSEMLCLNAGCLCKNLAVFMSRFQPIQSFPGVELLFSCPAVQSCPGKELHTTHFSRKRKDPLSYHASVLSEANRKHSWLYISVVRCVSPQHCPIPLSASVRHDRAAVPSLRGHSWRFYPSATGTYQPPAYGLLRITRFHGRIEDHGN